MRQDARPRWPPRPSSANANRSPFAIEQRSLLVCAIAVMTAEGIGACGRVGIEMLTFGPEGDPTATAGAPGAGGASTALGTAGANTAAGTGGTDTTAGAAGAAGAGAVAGAAGGGGAPASCSDGIQNQDETGIDCSGTSCPPCTCRTWGAFGAAEMITGLGLSGELWGVTLSADGLTVFLAVGSGGGQDLFTATRPDRGTTFSAATPVSSINTPDVEKAPHLSLISEHDPRTLLRAPLWVRARNSSEGHNCARSRFLLFFRGLPQLSIDQISECQGISGGWWRLSLA